MTTTPAPPTPGAATPPDQAARRAYTTRIACLYAGMFTVFGVAMPYLSPWLVARGLSVTDISILAAVPHLVRPLSTPAIAFIADRHQAHRSALIILAAAALAGWTAMIFTAAFWPLFAIQILIGISNAMMPLTETITMQGVRRYRVDYGQVRLWGSIAFIVAALLAGIIVTRFGIEAMMVLIVLGAIAALISALALPRPSREIEPGVAPAEPLSIAAAARLLTNPALICLLLASAAVQASHATLNTFSSLQWQANGLSGTWIGALWATSVIAEIILFAVAGRWVNTRNAMLALAVGAVVATVRWLMMAADPALPLLVLLQTTHALSFGASHLGAVHIMNAIVPPDRLGTAYATASVVNALAFAIATPIAGSVFASNGAGAYLPMAAIAVFAVIMTVALYTRLNQARPY